MSLDDLNARFDELLARYAPRRDARGFASDLQGALVEAKAAIAVLVEALARTESELEAERRQRDDAARRGRLAEEIGDGETVTVAGRFEARHGDRVAVLERKVAVQQDELRLAEAELAEMTEHYRLAKQGVMPPSGSSASAGRGHTPDVASHEAAAADRQARAAAVEAQLAALKRKLGKDGS